MSTGHPVKTPKKAALASFLGSTLEYYDFVIYGSASALIFNHLFFPKGDATVATIASLASFGVAYIARPIGGLLMSHIGDKIGRKTALMITLVVMGLASISIGLLPTYDSVGILATILLFACRIAQGFSAGAESAGASTMTMEHSPEGRRAFFTSSVMVGCSAGNVLAGLVFMPFLALPEEHLMSWGWRVPFLLSALVLLVAYFVRTHLEETPVFEKTEEAEPAEFVPAVEVLKNQWRDVLRIVGVTLYSVVQTTFMVYTLTYGTDVAGIPRATMVQINTLAMAVSLATIPAAAIVSDKIGRRPVLVFGAIGCIITTYLYFTALNDRNIGLLFFLCVLNQGFFYSCWNGVWTVYFPEMFSASVRYTGMAMGNQVGLVFVGFAPSIATVLRDWAGWLAVVGFVSLSIAFAAFLILTSKETAFVRLEDLGAEHDPLRKRSKENSMLEA
ncbi:MFS transporter [Corynebacterium poyangense]|uniref:MFS transporter n=1 Tax=Corynebacterium poyangense TaxID=2684405 RepID=A0A7H0SQJ8_9CORY|nr:MFS transporter [Corynebacterium poyangense]MBZ8178286.1 MFS transporter [Corynebacterium poyangense]QNQ90823.1 MFS transporter [Corynebacterium poyangense]